MKLYRIGGRSQAAAGTAAKISPQRENFHETGLLFRRKFFMIRCNPGRQSGQMSPGQQNMDQSGHPGGAGMGEWGEKPRERVTVMLPLPQSRAEISQIAQAVLDAPAHTGSRT